MKKPTPVKPKSDKSLSGQYIPVRRGRGGAEEDEGSQAKGLLDKLGPQEVVALAKVATEFASNLAILQKEREKTSQVDVQSAARMEEISVERDRISSNLKSRLEELRNERQRDKNDHKKAMKEIQVSEKTEKNRQDNISKILSMLEAGELSTDNLAILISGIVERP